MEAVDNGIVEIVLLGAPRGKERVRLTKTGHAYTPERTVTYEGRLAYAAQEAMNGRLPFAGPLAVDVLIKMPITQSWPKKRQEAARSGRERPTKKPDLDNIMKMMDAFNLIVWVDDSQVVTAQIEKHYSDAPGLWVKVRPLTNEAQTEGIFG